MKYEKLRDKVERLSKIAFGPYGECPDHIRSIDDLPFMSKRIVTDDCAREPYRVSVSVEIAECEPELLTYMRSNPVRLDGRCLIANEVRIPTACGLMRMQPLSIDFKQVQAC